MKIHLQTRYALAILLLVVVLVTLLSSVLLAHFGSMTDNMSITTSEEMEQRLLGKMQQRGKTMAEFLVDSLINPVYDYDMQAIFELSKTALDQEDVIYFYVFDLDGRIIHDGKEEIPEFGKKFNDDIALAAQKANDLLIQTGADYIDFAMPLIIGNDTRLGHIRLGLTLDGIMREIKEVDKRLDSIAAAGDRESLLAVTIITAALIALSFGLAIGISRNLSQPIKRLSEYAGKIGEGDDLAKIEIDRTDEIGELADSITHMHEKLKANNQSLIEHQNRLEQTVAERTQNLLEAKEAAEAASKAKSDFLATMSHEIRTPMNGVLGMTELLLGSGLNDREQGFAESIQRSGDLLLQVINDILDFSKIEAGKFLLENREFNLRNLLEDTVDILANRAHSKGLDLTLVLPLDPLIMVTGDDTRLRQVLVNLIGNAIKFTDNGEVIIRVDRLADDDEFTTYCFKVIDTGIGISTEQQLQIFEAFSQADSSTTRKFGGTGLGLAISNQIVSILGGDLRVTSQLDQGSTFEFTIKLGKISIDEVDSETFDRLKDVKILVVDDNGTNRDILTAQTSAWGMNVKVASSAQQALDLLRESVGEEQCFEVALLDWHMPVMDGIELAKLIDHAPEIPPLKLIMLSSAGVDGKNNSQAAKVGIGCTLNKPVRQARLYKSLCSVLTDSTEITVVQNSRKSSSPVIKYQGLKILLAEDNPVNQEVAKGMLERLGCEVTAVADGEKAFQAFKTGHFDIILMDCQMPDMDGFETTRRIRKHELLTPEKSRLAIIALTANVQKGIEVQCARAGMDDYLSKPFNQSQMNKILSSWVGDHSQAKSEDNKDGLTNNNSADVDVLQMQAIDNIRALQQPGEASILNRVIKLYLDDSRQQKKDLQKAFKKQDIKSLLRMAHSLKSSSANLGVLKVTDACKELELLGETGSLGPVAVLLEQIEVEHNKACKILSSLIHE